MAFPKSDLFIQRQIDEYVATLPTLTRNEIRELAKDHEAWLHNPHKGKRLVLVHYNLQNSDFESLDIRRSIIERSYLQGSNFEGTYIQGSSFAHSNIGNCVFAHRPAYDLNLEATTGVRS